MGLLDIHLFEFVKRLVLQTQCVLTASNTHI